MPIAKNLSNVPAGEGPSRHNPPVRDPLFVEALVQEWAETYVDEDPRATAVPCRIRHSDAGKCSRALSYKLLGLDVSEPLTLADYYRFNMGTMTHDQMQAIALKLWPNASIETVGSFGEPNEYGMVLSAGHGDLNIELSHTIENSATDIERERHHVEIKTINGYGFQRAIGLKGDAQGPRHQAVLQASLNALADDADYMTILLLSLDVVAAQPSRAKGLEPWERFAAEWRYPRAVFEPMARAELERFNEIVLLADAGAAADRFIPDPEIPEDALITNPNKGMWTVQREDRIYNSGETWHCGYCPYRGKCVEDLKAGL